MMLDPLKIAELWYRSIYSSLYLWLFDHWLRLAELSVCFLTIRAETQMLVVGEGSASSHPCPGLTVQLRGDPGRSDAVVAQDRSQLRRGAVALFAVVERIRSLCRTYT